MSSLEFLKEHFFSGVPRYEPLGTLGRGGMGIVYKAKDLDLDEVIAIKVLFAPSEFDEDALLARFKREVSLNRKIKHPNVARLHDFGMSHHLPYVTMEYVEGRDLGTVIETDGPLPPARAVAILRQVALGSAAAHQVGIVHRDIKPQNIMVNADGAVAILDFGLARGKALPGITLLGTTVGTPHYMSPEQARGKPTDARSDVYSIGVVAFEILTGQVLFDAPSPMAIALKQVEEPVPLEILPSHGVPPALASVVYRCLAKSPDQRFQSAAALESALALLGPLDQPDPEPLASMPLPPERPSVSLSMHDIPLPESMGSLPDVGSSAEAAAEGALARGIPSDLQFDSSPSSGTPVSREMPQSRRLAPVPALRRSSTEREVRRSLTLSGTPAPPQGRRPQVLVVDDEPAVRRLVRTALADSGCEILEAVTGQTALETLHEKGADLVVMDVQMPLLDGFDTARILRSQARFAKLPIVFASGHLDRNRLAFALQAGGTDFVEKPIDLPLFVEKVWRILTHLGFARAAG